MKTTALSNKSTIKSLACLAFKLGPVQSKQLKRQLIMNFKHLALTILLLSPALTLSSPSQAQTDTNAPKRALNLARDTAIRMNGGLSNYRPGRCMYQGVSNNRCLAQRDASGFIFHFPGGQPGWQESGAPPTKVTVLRVSPDGRSITQNIYNGPLSQYAAPTQPR